WSDGSCPAVRGSFGAWATPGENRRRDTFAKRPAVSRPVSGRKDRMMKDRTERSTDAGLHPEAGKAGSRLQDHLAATLAHELRNPLASILNGLHAIRHGGVDEAAARQAHDWAERQAQHMERIIEGVLDICRAG